MPLERFPADDPREWLNRARSNLLRAKEEVPGVYLEDLCFDAQQAAEKAIKGVLLARGIDFPYIHDLARLLTLLKQDGEVLRPSLVSAARLTRFAFGTRYPGTDGVTTDDYRQAVAIAETVVAWAAERIEKEKDEEVNEDDPDA